jgi:hypothetical protein
MEVSEGVKFQISVNKLEWMKQIVLKERNSFEIWYPDKYFGDKKEMHPYSVMPYGGSHFHFQ